MNYSYGNTLTIKSSPSEFEFHGKPNEPNVSFANGKQYISKKLYIHKPSITGYDGEICIEHTLSTNYDGPLLLYFPLQTDQSSKPNIIDRMISSNPGDSLEVNLNTILPTNGNFEYKKSNIAVFTTPIIINTRIVKDGEPVIEGAGCLAGSQSETIAKLMGQVKALEDIVNEHTVTRYPKHHTGGGAGSNTVSQEYLDKMLASNNIECTPLDQGSQKSFLQLLDIYPKNANYKNDITGPIAFTLVFIILSGFFYFSITSLYKRILQSQFDKFNYDAQPTLERMHIYEGLIGTTLFYLFILFVAPSKAKSNNAAGIFLIAWILYSITLGMTRKGVITDVMGSTYTLDDIIRNTMRTVTYNMFLFYPFFLIFAGGYMYKMFNK
jgi:hypothetical protein